MPAVADAVGVYIAALEQEGWSVLKRVPVVSSGPNPTEVDLRRGQRTERLLLYAWTCTHEGEGRPGPNQRVQWTPNNTVAHKTLGPVPFKRNRLAVGVGYWPVDEVFFAFDVWTKRLARWSTSIHVHLSALQNARTQQALVVGERKWD